MKKNTDFANSERNIFIAKTTPRQLKQKYAPAWPYYLASAVLAVFSLYLLYGVFQ